LKTKQYFLTGLLVWLPLGATYSIVHFLFNFIDNLLNDLPSHYQPVNLIGFNIPGLNIIVLLVVILLTGILTTNFLGKKLLLAGEYILSKIPMIRTLYQGFKKTLQVMMLPEGKAFRKVLLIECPRKGIYSIGFLTNDSFNNEKLNNKFLVFVPTTPNPTSGYLIIIDPKDCIELNISIEEALQLVISLGTISPKVKSPSPSSLP
jgi:uncharacterized membrane protein